MPFDRDALKQREKQLRGGKSDVEDVIQLVDDASKLPDDDSVKKRVRQLFASREADVLEHVQTRFEAKKAHTCRALAGLLAPVALLSTSSSMHKKLSLALSERQKSHRAPLEKELKMLDDASLKELARLRARMAQELSAGDDLLAALQQAERARELGAKRDLTARFKALVSAKKWKLSHISALLKDAQDELPEEDALVEQIKSLLETKVQQDQGLKPVRPMAAQQRRRGRGGGSDSDDNNGSDDDEESGSSSRRLGGKKRSSSSSTKKSFSRGGGNYEQHDASSIGHMVGSAKALVMGLGRDLTGAPAQSSAMYKLGILVCFLLYCAILSYSASLTIKVARVDLPDMSAASAQVLSQLRLRKSPAALAALESSSSSAAAAAAPPATAAAAASSSSKDDDDEEEDGGGGGGGGGDDDD